MQACAGGGIPGAVARAAGPVSLPPRERPENACVERMLREIDSLGFRESSLAGRRLNPTFQITLRISDTWLGQTWKWVSESKLSMRLRGLKALVCKADPLLHTAFTTARDITESRAACARFGVMRRSDLMQYDGEQLRVEARAHSAWEHADGGKWRMWVSRVREGGRKGG